ncbi:MAG: terminase family protein [Sphingomicrobium sp.]
MPFTIGRKQMKQLMHAEPEVRARLIALMSPNDMLQWDANFESWADEGQLPPGDVGWRNWLMMAGRGFGKTRAGAEWIHALACGKPKARIALAGASLAEARSIMVEGVSGLLSVARSNGKRVNWEPSLGRLTWPNGSQAQLFSGDSPDGLRGPEHDFAWCDELAKWREAEAAWDNLQMGLRRGPRARALVTTTPRRMPLLERIAAGEWTVTTRGRTSDNINLDEKFIAVMTATYGGTRLGRQELDGEILSDVEGALWTRAVIEGARDQALTLPPLCGGDDEQSLTLPPLCGGPLPLPHAGEGLFDRILVGVDPPAGVGSGSDACGIIVAGSAGGKFTVLDDCSVQGLSPEGWASRVAAAAARWNAGLVVAEANNGGARRWRLWFSAPSAPCSAGRSVAPLAR